MRELADCRCCGGRPLVGWAGLCASCADTVERLLTLRRRAFGGPPASRSTGPHWLDRRPDQPDAG